MAKCKDCLSEKVCKYNDGHNLYCKEDYECPHFKTADVVEVVRCKDCVNYCGFEHCKNGICDVDPVSKRAVQPYDFCSYGERK